MKLTYALFAFASIASSIAATPYEAITADVAKIQGEVTSLDKGITALPTSQATIPQVVGIATTARALITAVNTGTTHAIITGNLSPEEAQKVVDRIQAIVPEVTNTLRVIVLKHNAFPDTSLALVGRTLRELNISFVLFADALIKYAKPNVIKQVVTIQADLIFKFKGAEAAFPV
ncbi:hypothetical protein DXG03_000984 [Asterophora parasitica]|uniref:Cell wall galactomannoprotein n=1 Tax=Asterophora parasitica TaxID=117018 RepID=A0A9P7K9H2_9AGAR|nr:hypothetical protein DXG03_000984 [Asterophora parasitica]